MCIKLIARNRVLKDNTMYIPLLTCYLEAQWGLLFIWKVDGWSDFLLQLESGKDQRQVIREAFASDNVVADFMKEKLRAEQESKPKVVDLVLPGWGEWGGTGLQPSTKKRKRYIWGQGLISLVCYKFVDIHSYYIMYAEDYFSGGASLQAKFNTYGFNFCFKYSRQ